MNLLILFLAVYFFTTGGLETCFPKRTEQFLLQCLHFKPFRVFSFWAFTIGFIAYLGSPVNHLMWFVVLIIWLYGFMGLWILINPRSFMAVCKTALNQTTEEMKKSMIRLDGLLRFAAAFLLYMAARA